MSKGTRISTSTNVYREWISAILNENHKERRTHMLLRLQFNKRIPPFALISPFIPSCLPCPSDWPNSVRYYIPIQVTNMAVKAEIPTRAPIFSLMNRSRSGDAPKSQVWIFLFRLNGLPVGLIRVDRRIDRCYRALAFPQFFIFDGKIMLQYSRISNTVESLK